MSTQRHLDVARMPEPNMAQRPSTGTEETSIHREVSPIV